MNTVELIHNIQLLLNDGVEMLRKRYDVLRNISYVQPVGRRQLAIYTGLTEREVRSEVEYLRSQGLIRIESFGMIITREGFRLLNDMQEYIPLLNGRDELQEKLQKTLEIKRVTIAAGDCNQRLMIYRDIGMLAALELREYLKEVKTIAVSGHSSVHDMAESQFPVQCGRNVTIYPIRTAQMNKEDVEANNNCAQLARKTGAKYKILHLGEKLTLNELEKRFHDPDVCEIVRAVENADLLICGITPLKKSQMLKDMSVRAQDTLMQANPCCELLGSFIKSDGKQVNNPPLYNISVDQIALVPTFMLIGAGKEYVDGILALSMRFKNMHLITDEATSNELLELKGRFL